MSRELAVLPYESADLIPANLKKVALVCSADPAEARELAEVLATIYQPSDTVPALLLPVGAVFYAPGDAIPADMLQLKGIDIQLAATCPAITPTLGAELVTPEDNRTFTVWGNVTWAAYGTGASIADGSGKAQGTLGPSGNGGIRLAALVGVIGAWRQLEADVWQGTTVVTAFKLENGGSSGAITITGSQATYRRIVRMIATDYMYIYTGSSDGGTFFADNISTKALTLSTCLAFLGRRSVLPGTYTCKPTLTAGTQAGLCIGYLDVNTGLYFYGDGTKVYLNKLLSGTWTAVMSPTATYSAGAPLQLIAVGDGTTYVLVYNSIVVAIGQITGATLGRSVYGFQTLNTNSVGLVTTSKAYAQAKYSGTPTAPVPAVGATIGVNGDMELDSDWTNFGAVNTNERSAVDKYEGTYSRHIVGDATTEGAYQIPTTVAGAWYRLSGWLKCVSGTGKLRADDAAGNAIAQPSTAALIWTQLIATGRAGSGGAGSSRLEFYSLGAAAEFYVDALLLEPATPSSLITLLVDAGTKNVIVERAVTCSAGYQEGIDCWLDDETNPQNYLRAYYDRSVGKVYLLKVVAGVTTEALAVTATYSAGAKIKIVAVGTSVGLVYNDVLLGVYAGATESTYGTKTALFSTEGVASACAVYA